MGVALSWARSWAEGLERPPVLLRPQPPGLAAETVVVPWVDRLARGRDLIDAAIAWVAQRLGQPAGSVGRSLRAMTPHEVERFLDAAVPLVSETGVELVVRRLIELATAGRRQQATGLAPEFNTLLEGRGRPWLRTLKALGELVPQPCLPILVVAPAGLDSDPEPEPDPALACLDGVARLLAELAATQPRAAIVLIVEPGLFDTYMARAPESRAKALLRETVLTVTGAGSGSWDRASDIAEQRAGGAEHGVETPDRESGIRNHESEQDAARSAAERFLFDLLDALPETSGLFQLNATLDFPFGPGRDIEVDLLGRSLKLAVEIDGYHHFQDPEAYRRDRRKDLELQRRGYLVLRFLAEDIVARLEVVLDTIVSAVAFCRHRHDRERGKPA
jgi:hypothetical protein